MGVLLHCLHIELRTYAHTFSIRAQNDRATGCTHNSIPLLALALKSHCATSGGIDLWMQLAEREGSIRGKLECSNVGIGGPDCVGGVDGVGVVGVVKPSLHLVVYQ